MIENVMPFIDTELVDTNTQRALLDLLLRYRTYDVLSHLLDGVTIELLLRSYPFETYEWLIGKEPPEDFLCHVDWYIDPRGMVIDLWKKVIAEIPGEDSGEGLPDGSDEISCNREGREVVSSIVHQLTTLGFYRAIHTWLSVWKEWIQVSNVDELLHKAQEAGLEMKVEDLPGMMAIWVEYQYRFAGW
jgi:hypothetical protein